jgi:hypothetical protein
MIISNLICMSVSPLAKENLGTFGPEKWVLRCRPARAITVPPGHDPLPLRLGRAVAVRPSADAVALNRRAARNGLGARRRGHESDDDRDGIIGRAAGCSPCMRSHLFRTLGRTRGAPGRCEPTTIRAVTLAAPSAILPSPSRQRQPTSGYAPNAGGPRWGLLEERALPSPGEAVRCRAGPRARTRWDIGRAHRKRRQLDRYRQMAVIAIAIEATLRGG